MDTEKNIVIKANTTQAQSALNDLRERASELAKGMMEDAAERGGSAKDMVNFLKEELEYRERIMKADSASRRFSWEERNRSAPQSDSASRRYPWEERNRSALQSVSAKKELDVLNKQNREDKLEHQLLKGIIDTILKTSKEEIEANKQGETERISKIPHERLTFKDKYKAGLLGMGGDAPQVGDEVSSLMRRRTMAGNISNIGRAALSGDPGTAGFGLANAGLMALSSTALIATAIIGVMAYAGKQIYDKLQIYSRAAGATYAVTGDEQRSGDRRLDEFGFSQIDHAQRQATLARQRRSGSGVGQATYEMLLMSRGIGLEESRFGQMEQLSLLNGQTGYGNIQRGIGALRGSGAIKGEDMSALPDYLDIMIQLSKEQLSRLGNVDIGVNTKMVSAMSSLDETMKRSPEATATMVNAVRGGLSGSSSPQSDALKYSVLSRMKPGASMFDLMKMKEDPFNKDNQGFLLEFLGQLKKMSGGRESQFNMNIMRELGLSASMAEKLSKGFNSGGIKGILDSELDEGAGVSDIEGRAKKATSWQDKMQALKDNALSMSGEVLVGIGDGVADLVEQNTKIANVLLESDKKLDKIVGHIVYQNPYLPIQ